MRLRVSQLPKNKHTKMVTGVGWTPSNELFSVSDEKLVHRWSIAGEPGAKVCDLDSFATDFHWYSTARGAAGQASREEFFAVGCSDGTVRLINKTGRLEKSVDAHTGAVTAIKWSWDGTALATAGEDGLIKQWSPNGNLRSKLAQSDRAIYSVCWSPDNQSVLFCSGRFITIKPLRVSGKQSKWKAHEGTVLKVDWNPVTNLIVSGGEDCKYKVFDSFGHALFTSRAMEFPVTSLKWCPSGDYFAVGLFNQIALCDKTGWVYSRSRSPAGSIMAIDWTSDGTHLAGAGANGAVVFGKIVDRSIEWKNYEVTLNEKNQVIVQDVLNDNKMGEPPLEFGTPVIDMAMAYNQLVVVTSKSCNVYSSSNFSTPHIFDVKGTVTLILLTPKAFVLVDTVSGVQVFSYEGRQLANPRVPSLNPAFLKVGNVAVSADTLAIIDRNNPTQVHILDLYTGKPIAEPVKHEQEIVEIALNQTGLIADRKLAFIDRNRELYIAQVHRASNYKLQTMVDCAIWNESADILAAVSDSKLQVWYYPNAVYVDKDLVALSKTAADASAFGKNCSFTSFVDTRVTVRRADGALQTASVLPYPAQLHRLTAQAQWSRALRLCRVLKDDVLWACLAAMALHGEDLDTAEVALAAINEVDKLQYVQMIKGIPSVEGRNAELMVYRRRPEDGEQILIQGKLIWRAIKLNITLFRWERALELAAQYKTHVDTVLAYRQKFLKSLDREESDARFIEFAAKVPLDWAAIQAKEAAELDKERERGTPYESRTPAVAAALEHKEERKSRS